MQRGIKILSLLLCAVLLVGFASCGSEGGKEDNGKISIVCTLFPQYDFVRQLAGDKAEVTLLLTPGTDSHSYDPSPVDMVNMLNDFTEYLFDRRRPDVETHAV